MSARLPAATGILGIALGVALGSAFPLPFLASAPPPAAERPAEGAATSVTAPSGTSRAALTAAPSSTDPSGGAPMNVEAALRAAVAAYEAAQAPAAAVPSGVIVGVLVDEARTPLAGVEVRALPQIRSPGGRAAAERAQGAGGDPAAGLLETLAERMAPGRREVRATTEADGGFRITGLDPAASYFLRADVSGYVVARAGDDKGALRPGGPTAWLIARAAGEVEVEVVTSAGVPLDAADVTATGAALREPVTLAWSPTVRRLRLPAGSVKIVAVTRPEPADPIGAPVEVGEATCDVVAGRTLPLTVVLRGRPTIHGRLVSSGGPLVPPSLVGVHAARIPPGKDARSVLAGSRSSVRPGGDRYVLPLKEPGTYAVAVGFDDELDAATEPLVVEVQEAVELDLAVPPLPRERTLPLRIVGSAAGDPREGYEYRMEYPEASGANDIARGDLLPRDGLHLAVVPRRVYELLTGSGVETVSMNLFTASSGHDEAIPVPLPAGGWDGTTPIVVPYDTPGTLEVTAVGPPEMELRYLLRRANGDRQETRHVSESAKVGVPALLGPAAPGTYILEVHGAVQLATQEVLLASGRTPLTVSLPPLHELRVRVSAETPYLELVARSGSGGGAVSATEGECVFAGVPAGDYVLSAQGRSLIKLMRVTVPASGTVEGAVEFVGREPNCLLVGVVGAQGGPLRTRDLITAIDGASLDGMAALMGAYGALVSRERVRLSLRRDGAALEVEVPSKDLLGNRGIEITPFLD